MKSISQLLVALALSISGLTVSAQTVETTPNLVTNIRGTSGTDVWLGTGGNSQLNGVHPTTLWGCCTSYSGSSPFFDTSTTNGNGDSGQIIWSWGNVAVNYIIGINTALANAGTGIQINGYNWRYDVRNMNGESGQGGVDTLTATSRLWNSTYNTVLLQQSRTHNTTMDWTTFSSTVTAASPHPLANVGNLALEFRGGDSGFWTGYYGPQIRDVRASFNYTAAPPDPCVTNPQSSPSCPGYTIISDNLVPFPNHWTTNGQSINQTYAINQALSSVGAGVVIHGFNYGYQYNLGSSYSQCTAFNQDGSCSWTMTFNPRVDVNFKIRSNTNSLLYDITHSETGANTGNRSRDYQYRFASPQSITSLGTIGYSASAGANSTVFGMYSRAAYTIDQCVVDPLSSTTCPGYAQAYLDQQCSANALYSNQCAGYAQAYFDQQCSNNALYSAQCPGYAQAYFNQQCSNNALYSTACPGYATAYYNYQCSVNPLYHTGCTGYAQAYFNQQCGLNPLYNSACPGYADAYYVQQCGIDPLYDSGCTGYKEAYAKKYILAAPAVAEPTSPVQEVVAVVAQAETPKETVATVAVASEAPAASVSPADKTAPVQLTAAPAAAPAAAAPAETKRDAAPAASSARPAASATRQALAERRAAAAQAASQQAAAEKANSGGMSSQMDSAASMEQQVELQNVVLGAMGFVAGFDVYGRATIPDAAGYRPFVIYPGQRNIDTPAGRRLLTGSDRLHQDMVDSQYKK
jgi:hypothetical protein